MTEDFLQYIWQYGYFNSHNIKTTGGENIIIRNRGILNKDSGPDFFNARIIIGQTEWAGNVEIHLKSSDWQKHKHQNNKAYNNVILHVVYEDDYPGLMPTLEMKNLLNPDLYLKYINFIHSSTKIPCQKLFKNVPPIIIDKQIERCLLERLEEKTLQLKPSFDNSNGNWEEFAYRTLAAGFGLKNNVLPFELLAKSLPVNIIKKLCGNLFAIEAILFGQSGLLDIATTDDYVEALKKEYVFHKNKLGLKPIEGNIWKFAKMRPIAFPTIRIAQFAAFINNTPHIMDTLNTIKYTEEWFKIFSVKASAYWDTHYVFGKTSNKKIKTTGKDFSIRVLANVAVPLIFFYANYYGEHTLKERAIALLEQIPPEKNNITRMWQSLSLKINSTAITQGIIQLNNKYCIQKKCLNCSVGNYLIKPIEK
jgi:hypothetical protein